MIHFKCFDYEYDFLSFQNYRWTKLFLWNFFNSCNWLFHYKFSQDLLFLQINQLFSIIWQIVYVQNLAMFLPVELGSILL